MKPALSLPLCSWMKQWLLNSLKPIQLEMSCREPDDNAGNFLIDAPSFPSISVDNQSERGNFKQQNKRGKNNNK